MERSFLSDTLIYEALSHGFRNSTWLSYMWFSYRKEGFSFYMIRRAQVMLKFWSVEF